MLKMHRNNFFLLLKVLRSFNLRMLLFNNALYTSQRLWFPASGDRVWTFCYIFQASVISQSSAICFSHPFTTLIFVEVLVFQDFVIARSLCWKHLIMWLFSSAQLSGKVFGAPRCCFFHPQKTIENWKPNFNYGVFTTPTYVSVPWVQVMWSTTSLPCVKAEVIEKQKIVFTYSMTVSKNHMLRKSL